jgi:hypothetical protein
LWGTIGGLCAHATEVQGEKFMHVTGQPFALVLAMVFHLALGHHSKLALIHIAARFPALSESLQLIQSDLRDGGTCIAEKETPRKFNGEAMKDSTWLVLYRSSRSFALHSCFGAFAGLLCQGKYRERSLHHNY